MEEVLLLEVEVVVFLLEVEVVVVAQLTSWAAATAKPMMYLGEINILESLAQDERVWVI